MWKLPNIAARPYTYWVPPAVLLLTVCITSPAAAQGDYANIAILNYGTDMPTHGCMASTLCSVMQMQSYLRTGTDPGRLSPQFLMSVATQELNNPVYYLHGFSSPIFGWQMAYDYGSCPSAMCRKGTFRVTDAMRNSALPYRVGGFIGYADIPNYTQALQFLAANHGAAVLLSTDGYQAYAIIGLDAQGRGIWLNHYQRNGPPEITYRGVADGQALWDRMTVGKSFTPPNYVAGVLTRAN